jgi:hypothetical protein
MSPAFVPSMKELVRRMDLPGGRDIAERVLGMTTVADVRNYLGRMVKQVWPEVTLLDVSR